LNVVEPDDFEAHGCLLVLLSAGTDLAVDPRDR
jgi:hypothetical protein